MAELSPDDPFEYGPALSLDGDESRPASLIGYPAGFAVAADGAIYIADGGNQRIVVFDESGSFERAIGSPGEGPGEFRVLKGVRSVGGTIAGIDGRASDVKFFSPDGQYLDSLRVPRPPTSTSSRWNYTDSKAFVTSDLRVVTVAIEDTYRSRPVQAMRAVVRVIDGDAVASTFETSWLEFAEYVPADVPRGSVQLIHHFAGFPDVALGPNGLLYATTGEEPLIEVWNLSGTRVARLRLDSEPVAISDGDRRATEAELEARYDAVRSPSPTPGRIPIAGALERVRVQRNNPRYARVRAFWVSIDVDDQGFIWLGEPDAAGSFAFETEATEFLVLSPDGDVIGRTRPPGPGRAERGYWLTMETHPVTGEYRPTLYRIQSRRADLDY